MRRLLCVFCALFISLSCSSSLSARGDRLPDGEPLPNNGKLVSITIEVKSAANGMPIQGANVKLVPWFKFGGPHNPSEEWKPLLRRELHLTTNHQGRIHISRHGDHGVEHLFGSYGGYYYTCTSDKKYMLAVTARSSGFAEQRGPITYLNYDNPHAVITVYLPPR